MAFAVASAAMSPSFAGDAGPGPAAGAGGARIALFADTEFRRGFLLAFPSSAKGRAVEKVLESGDGTAPPAWRLCQWATRLSLAGAPDPARSLQRAPPGAPRLPGGGLSWENETKRVAIGGGAPGRPDLVLEVRGGAEYLGRTRRPGEAWPHLLVEQDAARIVTLDRLSSLDLEVSLRLASFADRMDGRGDPSLHAAQFQIFFIVKEVAPGAGGDFIWFGVPFFDSRSEFPPPHRAKDVGKADATGKFIYTIDGREVLPSPPGRKEWIAIRKNLLPAIAGGLTCAVERGFLKSADPGRFAVANMNMGWEIPGAFDAAVEVRGLSVTAVLRPEPAGR